MDIFVFKTQGEGIELRPSSVSNHLSDAFEVMACATDSLARAFRSVVKGIPDMEINIVLTDIEQISALNKKFRKINQVTDVLSFPFEEQGLGEVWVCPEVVQENANSYNEEYKDELLRVVIHGMLHLFGYDHEKPYIRGTDKLEKMFDLQEQILNKVLEK